MTITAEQAAKLLDGTSPGPWAYEPHGDTGDYGVGVCYAMSDLELAFPLSGRVDSDVMVYDPICPEVAGQGNAAIIAAAPDLARALIASEAARKLAEERLAKAMDAREKIKAAYEELLATVHGECPSLINEDSGGSQVLLDLILAADEAITTINGLNE